MQIRFVPEAEAELAEARTWYRSQREGLDVALMQRVDDALARIVENPKAFPVVQSPFRRATDSFLLQSFSKVVNAR